MPKPTREQIEAVAKVLLGQRASDKTEAATLAKAALTAAAQVAVATPEEVYETLSRAELRSEIVKLHMRNAATIERCAQVAEAEGGKDDINGYVISCTQDIAAAIRALKE